MPVSSQHSNARMWKPVFRVLGSHTCGLLPSAQCCCAVGLISQEGSSTSFLYKEVWNESLGTAEAQVVRVYGTHLLFLCTLICTWTPPCCMCVSQVSYFPQATSCHFFVWIKDQLLTLLNCRFLSICDILLFSLFLDVSPVLLAVGDFIPELFISSFRLFVSTKKNSTLIHWFMHCLTGQNSLHLHEN